MWLSGLPNVAVRRALGAFFRVGLIGAAAIASRAGLLTAGARAQAPARPAHAQSAGIWTVPEVGALPRDASGLEIRKGRDLITATYAYIGRDVADASNRYAGNNLACSNCHLEAGTKKFGLPLFGLYTDFPQYSARTGGEISIEDRVNSCMRRSMNGRALPTDAPEMQAIVAYIKFISSGVAPDQRLPGLGTGKMPELNRAAEPARGEPLYLRDCAACHKAKGRASGKVYRVLILATSFRHCGGRARSMTALGWRGSLRLPTSSISTCRTASTTLTYRSASTMPGTLPLTSCRIQGRTLPASNTTFRIYCQSRWTRLTDPMPTTSANFNTNMGRSSQSWPRSSGSAASIRLTLGNLFFRVTTPRRTLPARRFSRAAMRGDQCALMT